MTTAAQWVTDPMTAPPNAAQSYDSSHTQKIYTDQSALTKSTRRRLLSAILRSPAPQVFASALNLPQEKRNDVLWQ